MTLRSVIVCFFISFFHLAHGQKPGEYVILGDQATERQDFDEAFAYYEKAWLMDTTNFEVTIKYAEAARDMKYYKVAMRMFTRIWEKDKGKLYPHGQFELARMEQMMGWHEDAYRNFVKYYKKQSKKEGYRKECENYMLACEWAVNYRPPAILQEIEPLGSAVNSGESEIAPFVLKNQFYFSSTRESGESWKVYKGDWENEEVRNVEIFSSLDDSRFQQANLCSDVNKTRFYFSRSEGGKANIYAAPSEISSSQDAVEIKSLRENGAGNTSPHLASLGGRQYLFFASDRAGGQGGMDIWFSEVNGDNVGTPVNAGPTINTQGDEITPFVYSDKLYFASDWWPGFGGYDMFAASVSGSIDFGKSINVGLPQNSPQNDLYPAFFPEIKKGFFASNREGSMGSEGYDTCCNDLYAFDLPEEEKKDPVYASLEELNNYLPVTLYFHNDEPNPDSWDTLTQIAYSQSYASLKNLYTVYEKENSKGLSNEEVEEAMVELESFFRLKVDKGVADLDQFTTLALKELEAGKRLRVAVRGFASPRAQSDYNLNLTRRRINSLENELRSGYGGKFIPYLDGTAPNGGRIEVVQLPFGEYNADKKVSDDLANERKSIYSVGASLERKIEIQSVTYMPEEPRAMLEVEEVHDFGMVQRGKVLNHIFVLKNTGNAPLVIDSLLSSCGCTVAELEKQILQPGETSPLKVSVDTARLSGPEARTITLYLHGEEPRVLTLQVDVR